MGFAKDSSPQQGEQSFKAPVHIGTNLREQAEKDNTRMVRWKNVTFPGTDPFSARLCI